MKATGSLGVGRILVEGFIVLVAIALGACAYWIDPFWIERHASSLRCIEDPHLVTVDQAGRLIGIAIAILLIAVVRPRLGRYVATHPISLARTIQYLFAVVLALTCSELLLRRPSPPRLAPEGYSPAHTPDPVFAWRLTPAAQHLWHEGGKDFLYAVNDEGNRARSIHDDPDHEAPTILIGGESIAMGMGNPYEDSFASRLQARTGIQVVDLGVDAYGLDQAYMREKEVLPTFAHTLAIVTVFHPEMAERAEVEDRPRLRVEANGNLQLVPPTDPSTRDLRLRQIFRGLYHSSAELDDLRALVRDTAALARSDGAYPLFLTLNFSDPCLNVNGKEPFLFRLIDEQHIPRIHVYVPPSERLSDDQHPGPIAHEHIAEALEQALRDAQVLP